MSRKPKTKTVPIPSLVFTAEEIILRNVDELIPFRNNPKQHTPAQIDALALNIKTLGFDQPILIDEDSTILKGHGRQLAARKAGRMMVPTITRPGLSFAEKWAIVISDNVLPAMTGLDQSLLRIGMTTLAKADFNLSLTGLDNVRLATFLPPAGGASDPNDIPDLAPAISKMGDVWLMGDHRLICGDSSNAKTVAKLLGKDEPTIMLTDPPYRAETRGGGIYSDMTHTAKMKRDEVDSFAVEQLCELLETNIVFTSKGLLADYLDLARSKKLLWDVAVLHRQTSVPNYNGHLKSDLDYIVMMGKLAPKPGLEGTDYSKLFSAPHWERPVPWAKPVELIERLLRLYSVAGDAIFEPYAGSFTTGIACERLNRVCLAAEILPAYCDLAVRRWEAFSKKSATLQGSKKTFAQIEKDRSKLAV